MKLTLRTAAPGALHLRGHARRNYEAYVPQHLQHPRWQRPVVVNRASSGGDEQRPVQQQEQELASELVLQRQASSQTAPLGPQGAAQLPQGTVLKGQYTIQGVLGSGSNGTTYRATGPNGTEVAVKALSLRGMRDWKQLELFQREAKTLAALEHPGIPKYVDYFEEDSDSDRAFFLVQQAPPGARSLAAMVADGARATEQEARRIATDLLQLLDYLGSLRPPVIHRDIKPENIVIEGGKWGGRVYLVDFGGVQGAASGPGLGSTMVVGTYGYMAPEQFRGAAQPASDMYALGATLLFLLTGQPPSAFPQERMRINWRDSPAISSSLGPPWEQLLDGMLEPVAEDRLTPGEALQVLQGQQLSKASQGRFAARRSEKAAARQPLTPSDVYALVNAQQSMGVQKTKPAGSRLIVERSAARLDITIPPKGLGADTAMTGVFAIAWNAFVATWTVGAFAGGGILFALFSIPFWFAGAQLAKSAFSGFLMKERMAIGRSKFRIGRELAVLKDGAADFLGGSGEQVIEGETAQLLGARVVTTMIVNGNPQTAVEVVEGVNKYRFGEALELQEQQYLVYEINAHVEDLKGRAVDFDAMPAADAPRVVYDNEDEQRRVELPPR